MGRQILDSASLRAELLLRRLNDVIGLVRQAHVELQWKEIVTSWLRRLADAISKTPDGLRHAADAIDTAEDVLSPFYDQWRKLENDIEKIVRGNLPVFTHNLRLAADRLERRRSSESVLFVDDEEAARAFAAHALRTAYRNVERAESGAGALSLTGTRKFDILITDVVMPDMGGLALASAFRKLDPDIAVLLVSGYAEAAIQREIKSKGYDFLPKPYSLEDLNKAVERTLAKGSTG
jgi:CheY-like chemotaxis protein